MVDRNLTPRKLAITLLVVIIFTGEMFWLNRVDVPLGYERYDDYGVSFLYPKICRFQEIGLQDLGYGSEPNDFAGLVQWQGIWENEIDVSEVIWFVSERSNFPRADLEAMIDKASLNSVVRLTSDSFMSTLQGEEVECAYIEVLDGSLVLSGVICVAYRPWSSPGVDRIFFIVYITLKDSASPEQISSSFQAQLNNLHLEGCDG